MAHQHNWNRVSEAWVHCMACDNWKSNSNKKGTTMTHTTEPTIDEIFDTPIKTAATSDEATMLKLIKSNVQKFVSDQVAKARIEFAKSLKSIEYPPSGKEYHFNDGSWTNTLNGVKNNE